MSSLELKGIQKSYGGKPVLRGVDLDLNPNETLVIAGPNGCGKSTLLRIIAGLENADSGDVLLEGRSLSKMKPHQRPIGFVSQLGGYYEHLNVRQNLHASLQVLRLGPSELASRLDWIVELLGLELLLDSKISSLSGGQIQKVALGRGLARKPRILLMDEPLNHLDRDTQQRLQLELARIKRELSLSILYVTHDSEDALATADRLAVLQHGVIQQIDRPQTLYDHPRTPEIASIFGSSPFLLTKGKVDPSVHPVAIRVWNRCIELTDHQRREIASRLATSKEPFEIQVGVRPESFRISPLPAIELQQNPTEAVWVVTVLERRFTGDGWMLSCLLDENTPIQLWVDRRQGDSIESGRSLQLKIDAASLCLFL